LSWKQKLFWKRKEGTKVLASINLSDFADSRFTICTKGRDEKIRSRPKWESRA